MALPTATFDAAKAIMAGLSIIQFTPTSGTAIVFGTSKVVHKDDSKYATIKRPDSTGVLRVVAEYRTEGNETFEFPVDEAKRLVTDLFAGGLSGNALGTVQMWTPSANDATGKCALVSDIFPASIKRSGDLTLGGGDFTTPTLVVTSKKSGQVIFTADSTIAA
jgi:hypothetical protein